MEMDLDRAVNADYVIVYKTGFQLTKKDFPIAINFNEIVCMPLRKESALRVGGSNGIDKYMFVTTKFGNEKTNELLGARVPLVLNSDGNIKIDYNQKIDYSFYDRCRNLASVVENFKDEIYGEDDQKYWDCMFNVLDNLIINRVRAIFKAKHNKALEIYGEQSVRKIHNELKKVNGLENLVNGIEKLEMEELGVNNQLDREM